MFLPFRVRHAQHIHACGDVFHADGRGSALLGRIEYARYRPPLQVVQRDVRDARAGELDVEEVGGGVGITLRLRVI